VQGETTLSKRIFIVWAGYHRRSDLLAQHFGATIHYVYYGRMGQLLQAPVRYLVQAWRTWLILYRERPDIIFVQNPPIFAVLVASLYTRIFGGRYVIDSHTGAFLSPKWSWSVGLHRMLSRGALTTIVHNESQGRLVQRWGCPYIVLAFTPGDYPAGESYPLGEKFNVAVICSFDADEPLEILFEAAGHLKEACFYLTGDAQRIDRRLLMKKPENILLTGYLSYNSYIGLLRNTSAIMDLVNNEHTLLMGAFEAVSLGVPLIVSDWPLLRNYFSQGTVYTPNTVEGICEGVRRMRGGHAQFQRGILLLQEQLQVEWTHKFEELQQLLSMKA
jgi:glycosyltransferase involved in cell wall biosynthesis